MFGAAGVTPLHVPAKHFGATGLDGAHHFQVGSRQFAELPVVFSVKIKHVGEFPSEALSLPLPRKGQPRLLNAGRFDGNHQQVELAGIGLNVLPAYEQVARRGAQVRVAEQHLERPDVHAGLE